MPRSTDISKILIIGSGPIIIGQSAEFDYSGTQACKALKAEGFEVVLANSNPATIMTDPEIADRTYIEPLTREYLEEIIRIEREMSPGAGFAILLTVGGQTALNLAIELSDGGVLEKYNGISSAQMSRQSRKRKTVFIQRCHAKHRARRSQVGVGEQSERRSRIRGQDRVPGDRPAVIHSRRVRRRHRVQPRRDAGSVGPRTRFLPADAAGLEESVLGWKEYELEVMRDLKDNVIIICSIENFDPMGVHTGDSITVAPAQTLTDREYQAMRDAAIAVIREIGVETGGSNIQFGVHPTTGRMVIIEMNPRVSRSSALASKATGFPIAKKSPPSWRWVTRWTKFQTTSPQDTGLLRTHDGLRGSEDSQMAVRKISGADQNLGPQMKSVGEVMSIGRHSKKRC